MIKINTTTGKQYNSRLLREQLLTGRIEQCEDQNAPIRADLHDINSAV